MTQRVTPQLRMTNWERTRAFYVDGLGFAVEWEHRFAPNFPVFAKVSRDGLALFLTEHNAMEYSRQALSGPGWQVVRPPRASVLEVLRECHRAGVAFAVLDPDGEKAKRVFPIGEILAAVGIS